MRPAGSPRAVAVARSGLLTVGVLLVGANLRASITSVGPVLADIRADLGISGVAASVLISVPLIAFAACSTVAPVVARWLGLERTLGASLLLLAVAIVTRSVPVVAAIWVGTALLGVAIALMNVLLPALVKRDYPDRVGRMTGLYSSVQSGFAAVAAGVAVPIAGIGEQGWRLSLGIWAGLAIIGLAVFLPEVLKRSSVRQRAMTPGPEVPAAVRARQSVRVKPYRSPWGSAIGWQVTIFLGLQSTVYYTFITWWPSVEQQQGISATAAGWHQFIFQFAGIVGNLAAATLIHRIADQRALAGTLAVITFVAISGPLWAASLAVVWVVIAGVGAGGSIVVALSLFGLRTHDHRQAAALSGMAQSVGYLMAAAGPLLFGLLHDLTGEWSAPLIALLVVIAAQFILGTLAGRHRFITADPPATAGNNP